MAKSKRNVPVILFIKSDSTFLHSIATLEFKGKDPFRIYNDDFDIVELRKGIIKDEFLEPIEDKGNYIIELDVVTFYDEKAIYISENSGKTLADHYGMRFYPFISSSISRKLQSDSCFFERIVLELPDKYRLIFDGALVLQNNYSATLTHSFGFDKSKYIFSWKEDEKKEFRISNNVSLQADIPIRFGGFIFIKLIEFPIMYWTISLIAVVLTSYLGDIKLVIGAVVTSWLFMLQRWGDSNVPQQNTILTSFYIVAAILLGIWGFYWELFGSVYELIIKGITVQTFIPTLIPMFEIKDCYLVKQTGTFYSYDNIKGNFTITLGIGFLICVIVIFLLIKSIGIIKFFKLRGELPGKLAVMLATIIMKGDESRISLWRALRSK